MTHIHAEEEEVFERVTSVQASLKTEKFQRKGETIGVSQGNSD